LKIIEFRLPMLATLKWIRSGRRCVLFFSCGGAALNADPADFIEHKR
jgi:hypothetical protein